MKYLLNSIILFIISMSLLACDNKDKAVPPVQEEVYDFRNEKYQDFYSRFMRKVERVDSGSIVNNTFQRTFDKKFIESHLGAKDAPKEIVFKLIVERVDEKHILQAGGREIFHNLDEIKHRYNYLNKQGHREFSYQLCLSVDEEIGLDCLKDLRYRGFEYFYFANGQLKDEHIYQFLSFLCDVINNQKICELSVVPSKTHNIRVTIYFGKPQEFFYIMPYVEKYFYQMTGEHLWQTSLKEN